MEIATKQKVYRRGGSAVFHCILQPLTLHMCHGSLTALQPLTISAWLSKPKSKKRKTKKPKKNMTRPNSLPLLPPWGVQSCFFLFFFGFLFSGSLLVFLQWLNKTKIKKEQKTKNPKNKKQKQNDKTQLSATTPPPLGCAILFFFVCFFLFFVFWCVVGFCAMVKQNQNPKPKKPKKKKNKKMTRPNSLPILPPLGCAILFFFVFVVFFFFCFFGFLVSWCFSFLVSWFLVFWFVVGFLKGWQNNTKVKDLDFTLCQFSHFRGCKLAFG